jgi:2-keto-4-pentenoate hydratase/2-oxohepta-3-ene-1,7-dioic acid hydratase in catechol pathway
MKLCRFNDDRLGVVKGQVVRDVTDVQNAIRAETPYAAIGDAVIAALPKWRDRIEEAAYRAPGLPMGNRVKLLSPVLRPSKVMAAPVNYKSEAQAVDATVTALREQRGQSRDIGTSGIFLKSNSSVVGPSEGIPLRFPDRRSDFEGEIVVIIGKEGSDIPRDKAMEYVAGYAVGLDMTLRGLEDRSFRKSLDGYTALGPWMVTPDEIADPNNMGIKLWLNDELKQDSTTQFLNYDIARLIEFASSFYRLYPGDLYYTGTPAGIGQVVPGDALRVECPEIGAMEIAVRQHVVGG